VRLISGWFYFSRISRTQPGPGNVWRTL